MTYGDSACDSGAAMAISGRRRLFHETTGLVRIASFYVFAPWRLCVEFPSDFRRMERNVAEGQRRNVTKGCCLVSRFNEPSAGRRKLCFLPVSRVLQWRNQEIEYVRNRRIWALIDGDGFLTKIFFQKGSKKFSKRQVLCYMVYVDRSAMPVVKHMGRRPSEGMCQQDTCTTESLLSRQQRDVANAHRVVVH